jgi:hypothetical protein
MPGYFEQITQGFIDGISIRVDLKNIRLQANDMAKLLTVNPPAFSPEELTYRIPA